MMDVKKSAAGVAGTAVSQEDLREINALAKGELTAEQVYTFAVRLCDNEVDRDFERFSRRALEELGELFLGRSGIFDHQWSAREQTARIYRTEVVEEPGILTETGESYCYLKGYAYMLRSEKNAELIAEIEGGIKKEVSVGCSMKRQICSICGRDHSEGACGHVPGRYYDGQLCYLTLEGAADAYEWSFVAVPAQREAGVVRKGLHPAGEGLKSYLERTGARGWLCELETLEKEARLGRDYLEGLRKELVRLACTVETDLDGSLFSGIVQRLEERELLELRRICQKRADAMARPGVQIRGGDGGAAEDGTAFLV